MVSPHVMAPSVPVANKPPSKSSGGAFFSRRGSRTNMRANTIAPIAGGRLIKKIERHPTTSINQPPKTGPTAAITAPIDAQMPTARPRASPKHLRSSDDLVTKRHEPLEKTAVNTKVGDQICSVGY